jgi:predicted RNA-binding Zn ribbon-like protein
MSDESHFFIIGGELCLEFGNAANRGNPDEPIHFLNSYADLIHWAQAANALSAEAAERLLREAKKREAEAAEVTQQALTFQDTIYRIFSAQTLDQEPRPRDLETLNSAIAETLPHQRIVPQKESFEWTWGRVGDQLDYVLWPIVRSAADLLTSDRRERVKRCGGCNWLFLDTSKNGSRRWCTMEVCGNRAKARRHYALARTNTTRRKRK